MNFRRAICVWLVGALAPLTMYAQGKAGVDPAAVLAQLDAASQHFANARADFRWDYYERVVKDTTAQAGSIYFERKAGSVQMGAVVRDPSSKSPQKVIQYKDGSLQMFDPGVDQITLLKAGANQAQYESFLTLGFGGSGKDLDHAWTVTDMGPEPVAEDPGIHAEKLDLVSKDANIRNMFTHVTLWVDPARGISLKQVFYTPSGDIRTAVYTQIKVNTKIDSGTFAIKKDKNTTTVQR